MIVAIANASEDAAPGLHNQSLKNISADEILTSASKGPVTFSHARIIGDLKLNLPEYKSIEITDSIFEGNLSLISTTITEKAYFKNISFLKGATFFAMKFGGEADFNSSHFHEAANFSFSRFMSSATFDYTTFDKDAKFSAVGFDNAAGFYNATFLGDADFSFSRFSEAFANFQATKFLKNVTFEGSLFDAFLAFSDALMVNDSDFHGSKFDSGVDFSNTIFSGSSRFDRSHFIEDSIFRDIIFNNSTDFRNAKFDGPSFFSRSRFCKNAIFDGAQFISPSDFSNTQFDKDLGLNSTKINTMVFNGASFNSSSGLYMAKADINRFMANWSLIKDILRYDGSAYLSLVKNYRDMGMNEGDDCYYQYRCLNQNMKNWGWPKFIDMLGNISCGYGVKPSRPVLCSLILILFCTAVLFGGKGLRHPSNKDKSVSLFDSLYYCLAIFFTIPLPDLKPNGKYRYVPVFLRALAWTLFALLIGTLGRVMIK